MNELHRDLHNDFADVRLVHDPRELHRARPMSRLVRVSIALLCLLAAYAWLSGDLGLDEIFAERRLANLQRFLKIEIWPFELRGKPFSLSEHAAWAWQRSVERGFAGALATLSISVLAITLAGLSAAALMLFAARNVAHARPFESWASTSEPDRERWQAADPRARAWLALTLFVRGFLILLRAIPEYIWAFLLLAMLGLNAWPAVLALAIHNAGILGRLGAETIENLDGRNLRALRMLGASRAQIAAFAIQPLFLGRFLLYFFYRFETCVREATVLGMLGVVSLGYWIQDARSRQNYDQMILYMALGSLLVLAAELVSALVRARLRRAGG